MPRFALYCLLIALVGCSGSTINTMPTPVGPTPVVVPTVVPEPGNMTPTANFDPTAVSPRPDDKTKTFSDPAFGFSFQYPLTWTPLDRAPDAPRGVTVRGPAVGPGTEPIIFAITIDIEPASGETVKGIVDEQIAQVPAVQQKGISRQPVSVGGEPGEEVFGLPTQSGAIETFVLSQGEVILVILQPYDPGNAVLFPYLSGAKNAYDMVLASWQWLR